MKTLPENLNFDVVVDEEDNAIYIKIDGFDKFKDTVEYAKFLNENMQFLLTPTMGVNANKTVLN